MAELQNDILFSFVIPTFNRPNSLKVALQSVIHQDYPKSNYEVIIVDNSHIPSAEIQVEAVNTGELLVSYYHEPKAGAHNARNLGAQMAKGKFLVFLDDDCEADAYLLRAYETALQSRDARMAGGKIEIKWDESPSEVIRQFEYLMGKIDLGDQVKPIPPGGYINGGNMVITKELYLCLGGMEPDQVGTLIAGSGDTGLCHRVQALDHDIFWVPEALVYHWQVLNKNGHMRDLLRREFNNGIVRAFEDIERQKLYLRRRVIVHRALARSKDLLQNTGTCLYDIFVKKSKINFYQNSFGIAISLGYMYYCVHRLVLSLRNRNHHTVTIQL